MQHHNQRYALLFAFIFNLIYLDPAQCQNAKAQPNPCDRYRSEFYWLPDAYIANATTACNLLSNDSLANQIRNSLLLQLQHTDTTLIKQAMQYKTQLIQHEMGKKQYKKFVRKNIVPLIYQQHKRAYKDAGCTCGPAPYWRWKYACLHTFKNGERMFRLNVRFGGACTQNKGGFSQ